MILLKINDVDFTANVNERSYAVQRIDYYSTWTDGNWKAHRVIARTKVSGSFTMTFRSETEYDNFLSAVSAVKTNGGWCPVSLWISNEKANDDIDAFLDFTTKTVWTQLGTKAPALASVSVKVTER